MSELKPCPRCMKVPRLVDLSGFEVICDCGIDFCLPDYGDKHSVVKAWNKRAETDLQRDLDEQKALINELRDLLFEASGVINDWGGYASEYFQEKHGLEGDVAKFHVLAQKTPAQSLADVEARVERETIAYCANQVADKFVNVLGVAHWIAKDMPRKHTGES